MSVANVAVVIPVYGRNVELSHALLSLVSEAALIREVLVIDDASPTLVEPIIPKPLVTKTRVIRLPSNVGSAAARNAGIKVATAEFVAFLDSDDVWLPGKLAAQLPLLQGATGLLAVATGWQVVDVDRGIMSTRIPVAADEPRLFASGCWYCPGSTVVLRRSVFETVGMFDPRLRRLEDLDWFLRFALVGGRLAVAPLAGAVIRRSAKSNRVIVDAAAEVIVERFSSLGETCPPALKGLLAWLDVERAFARWTEGRRLASLALIARSLYRCPRRRLQLGQWWRIGPPVLDRAQADALLGMRSHASGTNL